MVVNSCEKHRQTHPPHNKLVGIRQSGGGGLLLLFGSGESSPGFDTAESWLRLAVLTTARVSSQITFAQSTIYLYLRGRDVYCLNQCRFAAHYKFWVLWGLPSSRLASTSASLRGAFTLDHGAPPVGRSHKRELVSHAVRSGVRGSFVSFFDRHPNHGRHCAILLLCSSLDVDNEDHIGPLHLGAHVKTGYFSLNTKRSLLYE